jgi:hypothetical protein
MQLKPITAIAVLLLVVASLLVAGCTSSTSSSTVSTDYPTSGHSKLIEGTVAYRKSIAESTSGSDKPKAFEVTWITDTKAKVHEERLDPQDYRVSVNDITFTHYPNTNEASTYFNMYKGRYGFSDPSYQVINYEKLTGKLPTVYHGVSAGTPLVRSNDIIDQYMYQYDALVAELTESITSYS